jgi:hypothetical protein
MIALNLSPLFLWPSLLCTMSQAQNLQFGHWQQITFTATTVIPGRWGHAGAFLSSTNEFFVFGGWNNNYFSDFHSINSSSLQSTQLSASTPLGGRRSMALTSDLASNFYVHGGLNAAGMFLFRMCFFPPNKWNE